MFFFFKQKTTYDMRISDWSSDVCSSDLGEVSGETLGVELARQRRRRRAGARILDREHKRQRKVAAGERGVDLDRIALPAGVVAGQRLAPEQLLEAQHDARARRQPALRIDAVLQHAADRKSTRLNSSH